MLCRLGVYRLVVTHTFLYKKLDEYGKNHNEKILEKVICEGKRLQALEKTEINFDDHVCAAADSGRKIVFDNFDFKQQVHHMSETHQNIDRHWVSHMSTENRVAGNHLSTEQPPITRLLNLDNGKFIPNHIEQQCQREDYANLVSRIIVEKIACLHFLKTCASMHIKHPYSREMMQPTETVCLEELVSII